MGFSHLSNDRILKLIYNASAWEKETDPEIKAFLQFVSRNNPSDDFTDRLQKSVAEVKRNEIFRKEYMSMGVWETDIRDIAKQQGAQEKALEDALILVRDFNVPPEIAAEKMGASLDAVLNALHE